MEPELHGEELVAPPLLPSPVPPPVVPPASLFGPAILWRWNERLALIVGGLTILLLGVLAGRVLGPATAEVASNAEQTAAADLAPSFEPVEAVESAGEVNPPETVTAEGVGPTAAAPEPASEKSVTPVVIAPTPEIGAESEASIPGIEESPAEPVNSPVSGALVSSLPDIESRVASIVLPPSTLVCTPAKDSKDRKLSTALTWSESVDEASQQAEAEEKLVFLIHISGNFESPGFT